MNLQPGTMFGAYEIISFIGAGGMAEVYKARDARLNRVVAIKVLCKRPSEPEAKRILEREAMTADAGRSMTALQALTHARAAGI